MAHAAVRSGAAAVLTRSGSFACHGANILRAAQQRKPMWITDVEGFDTLAPGMVVTIDGPDLWADGVRPPTARGASTLPRARSQWFRSARHELCEWDLEQEPLEAVRRCYWSHRRYDRMTASVMTEGLRRSATALGGQDVRTFAEGELIWFVGAPSGDEIARLACDTVASTPLLRQQTRVYGRLVRHVRDFSPYAGKTADALASMYRMLTDYFSVHLLLHSTYEDVFLALREQLSDELPDTIAEDFFDILLSPAVISWQDDLNPRNHKDLLQVRAPVPLPETNPLHEVEKHRNVSLKWLTRHSPGLTPSLLERVAHGAEVEVLKEWKFALNKILFSRFGATSERFLHEAGMNEEELRVLSISEIISTAKEVAS
ncbi:hypothetical protein RKE30_35930 [Streptomyces sp. Li-HN-5-11]|uniref:hypothetical protein n=1 Tax=Streptomyces sp. Li-HN-5-11 TaxID=3075432 RepID=UPI0028AD46D0|nr:hypothetical protein [Streptomyces sp. Li-HN-5-11]WNM35373.1 hypothetical protein RKE30_35930 [Streptomyces sp. Li-HN-5-11]